MDRRTFGASLLAGALALGSDRVSAQVGTGRAGMMPMGPAEQRHVADTLAIGTVALLTSRMAQSRAARPMVRQFATFEVEEQTGVAQVLREISGMAPPPPSPADRAVMDRLARSRGAGFDRAYIMAQMDGHRRLLRVQERYLAEGRNLHNRHIAILARGRILEHLRDLETLQRMRG